ncbi:MAG: transposase family protein [Nitrospira sp.]|nr:transposase family protein [Nitrospira sp.]
MPLSLPFVQITLKLPDADALEEALKRYGVPEIFNTDQGSQYTSEAFTAVLKAHHVMISMDGKGRWVDNVVVERLWRSMKMSTYEPMRHQLRCGLA